jgi:hypothetical protein
MPRAGLGPAIPVFERPKTERVLDRAAIGTGHLHLVPWLMMRGATPLLPNTSLRKYDGTFIRTRRRSLQLQTPSEDRKLAVRWWGHGHH